MKATLIGIGCGADLMGPQAREALAQAEVIIGAARLLEELPGHRAETFAEYRPREILELLREHGDKRCCVVFSGDSGFYSGATRLLPLLDEAGIGAERIPGISCVQYFSARIRKPWQDWLLCSSHGRDCDIVRAVMQGRQTFFLTPGGDSAARICRELDEAGLGGLRAWAGEDLGTEKECVSEGTVKEFAAREFAAMNVLLTDAAPVYPRRVPGIPDGEFLRDRVPMTKQEGRAAALAKLRVSPEDVCWDVGAGTGSVSVELALQARRVYAAERDPEACKLIRANRERFCAWNLSLTEGEAPEVLKDLPAPDAVFVGGSGGDLDGILEAVFGASPRARVCVAAVSLETLGAAAGLLEKYGCAAEVTQVAVSRTKEAGSHHLLSALNPVFLVTGERAGGGA